MTGSRRPRADHDLMRFAHLGALGLFAIGGGFWLGLELDAWLATSPLLSLSLALLGAVGWMLIVVREASSLGSRKPPPEESRDDA